MCKPISDEMLWGDPDAAVEAAQMIEELLAEDAEYAGAEQGDTDYFNASHECPECGRPDSICRCRCGGQDGTSE